MHSDTNICHLFCCPHLQIDVLNYIRGLDSIIFDSVVSYDFHTFKQSGERDLSTNGAGFNKSIPLKLE
jgi:hypothetical protein